MPALRVLFIGESWLGSCARSLKEALARQSDVCLEEVNEDLLIPRHTARWLRAVNRVLSPAFQQELHRQIIGRVECFKPDVVVAYKGSPIEAKFVKSLKALGCRVVNVYPDYSPHAYGLKHKEAVGAYDLVISTKPFHPALWTSVYGYMNRCVFVSQGYDPMLHLVTRPPSEARFDLVLVGAWRSEYNDLMMRLGRLLSGHDISVAVGGYGWKAHEKNFPSNWLFVGSLQGRAYVDLLRQGRICLAPVTRDVVVNNVRQPGDEESTRTYELAAAHCFFIHRRTDFVVRLYDEVTEVPMYDTPEELSAKILHFLPLSDQRSQMATAAHRRAVPAYGLDNRARDVISALAECRDTAETT